MTVDNISIVYNFCFRPLHNLVLWPFGYAGAPNIHDGPTLWVLLFWIPNALLWDPIFEPLFRAKALNEPYRAARTVKQCSKTAARSFVVYFVFWLIMCACMCLGGYGVLIVTAVTIYVVLPLMLGYFGIEVTREGARALQRFELGCC